MQLWTTTTAAIWGGIGVGAHLGTCTNGSWECRARDGGGARWEGANRSRWGEGGGRPRVRQTSDAAFRYARAHARVAERSGKPHTL